MFLALFYSLQKDAKSLTVQKKNKKDQEKFFTNIENKKARIKFSLEWTTKIRIDIWNCSTLNLQLQQICSIIIYFQK